jgi:hypothetical protein
LSAGENPPVTGQPNVYAGRRLGAETP